MERPQLDLRFIPGAFERPANGCARLTIGHLIDSGHADLQTGPFGTMLHASAYIPCGTPVVAVKHIAENRLNHIDLPRISDQDAKRLDRYRVRSGDILFARKGAVERCALVREEEGWIQGSDCIRLRLDQCAYHPGFVCHQLGFGPARQALLTQAHGATMPSLNQSILRALPLVFPPRPVQERLAAIWDLADQAGRSLEDVIIAKIHFKQVVASGLLRARSGPDDRGARRLGELFRERVEAGRPELPLLAVTNDRGVIARETLARRDTSSVDKSRYLRVAPGDIAYNTLRMWQGVSGLARTEGLVSPDYTVCAPTEAIDSRFAAHFFKLPSQIEVFKRYSQGLTTDRWRLRFPQFASIRVPVPDLAQQRRIADVLDLIDTEVAILRRQLDLQRAQKQGLMEKLLSGEVPINEASDGAPGD